MSTHTPLPEAEESLDTPKASSHKGKYMIAIGLVLYGTFAWYVGWTDIRTRLLGADISGVAIATALIFAATWMRVGKWHYGLGARQHAVGLFFLSKATGDLTPGRLGEFAPMAMRNHRTPRVGAWILFDRSIEAIVTLSLGLYGLAKIRLLDPWQLGVVVLCVVSGVVFGVYVLTHQRLFVRIAERFNPGGLAHTMLMLISAIGGEVWQFLKRLPLVLGITIVTKVMDLVAIVLIFKAIQTSASFTLVATSKCALAIISSGPTPTVTGLPHGMQAWLMHYSAGIPEDALAVGIGIEVAIVAATFWISFAIAGRHIKNATVWGSK